MLLIQYNTVLVIMIITYIKKLMFGREKNQNWKEKKEKFKIKIKKGRQKTKEKKKIRISSFINVLE